MTLTMAAGWSRLDHISLMPRTVGCRISVRIVLVGMLPSFLYICVFRVFKFTVFIMFLSVETYVLLLCYEPIICYRPVCVADVVVVPVGVVAVSSGGCI